MNNLRSNLLGEQVGGSLAGPMHGIRLKRQVHSIYILE